jgi:hypothetical protein
MSALSAQPQEVGPRTVRLILALVLIHLAIVEGHAAAHLRFGIELTPPQKLFVSVVVLAGPLAAAVLLLKRRWRIAGVLLAASMAAAFVFGVEYHLVISGPDNIARVAIEHPGKAGLGFQVSAFLLAVTEALGCYLGLRVAAEHPRSEDA